jgi:hypothetical protein
MKTCVVPHARPKTALPVLVAKTTGGMKLLFDDENMCRGRPKIALPASGDQNVYYGSDTSVLWFGH